MEQFLNDTFIGTFWFILIGLPISWVLGRTLLKEQLPDVRARLAVAITFSVHVILYALGGSPENPYSWLDGIIFIPGAIVSWLLLRQHYKESKATNPKG